MRILKFPLKLRTEQMLELPAGSRLLSVGEQGDQIMLWALVHVDYRNIQDPILREVLVHTETHKIAIFNTGEAGRDLVDARFIGTVQMRSGLEHHVFELNRGGW